MNPKISKFKIYFMISSAVQVSIIAISLILILTSMDGRALAKKAESASKLSDYLLSSSGFNQMSSEDQVRYSMFFAQFGYGLETIQNAPQDQLVKSPSHTKQESGYHRLEGLQSERWWFAALFGEEVFGREPTRPRESACQAGSKEAGKPCVIGGHLSVFYDEVKNNIKIPKCRVPVEGTQCGDTQFSCSSFGLSDLFRVVDKYKKGNESKLICVPAEPPTELADRCGRAFADWRNHHFKKLFNENGKIELSDKVIDASQWPELENDYARLLAHFEKTVDCAQDKVERCGALKRIREGTYGNGVSWSYDPSTNTWSATIPGLVGTASFSGKPKGGAFFSGEMVDPDFQRSECANVLAAATDIKKSWDAVPDSLKSWVKQFRQKSDGVVPVNEREPSRRGDKVSI